MTENWTCSVKSLFVFRVSRFVVSVEYNAHDTRIKKIIGAENPYWKTGTINQHENRACPIRYRTLISKIRYKTACQTRQKPVPVFCYRFGADFRWVCYVHKSRGVGETAGRVGSASDCGSMPGWLVECCTATPWPRGERSGDAWYLAGCWCRRCCCCCQRHIMTSSVVVPPASGVAKRRRAQIASAR